MLALMLRFAIIFVLVLVSGPVGQARAQPVEVAPLAEPDAFSTVGRDTGLPRDLWRGASAETARTVLPLLAEKPLSPAAAALARRVLAAGAPGPDGVGRDPELAGARAAALLVLGDPRAAATILLRAPGLDRDPDLARTAAESALLAGDDLRACAVEEALTVGRGDPYWLRLRAYCQAIAGRTAEAQLTFDLAQAQDRDAIFGRLMGAKLAGVGAPGEASLRHGLDYALSRNLGLDLSTAKAAPAVAAAMEEPGPPVFVLTPQAMEFAGVAESLALGEPIREAGLLALLELAGGGGAEAEAAALLAASAYGPMSPRARGQLAALQLAGGKAPAGRNMALDLAAQQGLMGETALLALWISAEAGAAGPTAADRARIVRALNAVGLAAEARAFAIEGLLSLK